MNPEKRLVVVGGGAAGFFGAIRAKTRNPGLEVILLESAPKALGKVKISGGGRCNVTHACFDVDRLVTFYPRGQRELKGVFSRFGPQDTVNWFESHGVALKTEADGRMFPTTDDSQTIVDCLLKAAHQAGVTVITRCPVQHIAQNTDGRFTVTATEGSWQADCVLLATGSSPRAYKWVEALGHTVIPPVPSLFTFQIQSPLLADLSGISFDHVKATLKAPGEKPLVQKGPLLITHWGLSGPAVLKLSAWGARGLHAANYNALLLIDFVPQLTQDAVRDACLSQKAETPKKQADNVCPFNLSRRFWERLLQAADIVPEQRWGEVSQKAVSRLVERLKGCEFGITGKGVFKEEFVTAGGVPLKEIDLKTMESRRSRGLYLAGELIDVDGLTGGFNFQNAWSTGWLAGDAVAASLHSDE